MSPRADWDGQAYHRISGPQFAWGMRVLESFAWTGAERVLDAGCGSGRLTAELAARVPRGHVIGLDRSRPMLQQAKAHLSSPSRSSPTSSGGPPLVCADLLALPFRAWADVVFSTATFHWVLDHSALFRGLHGVLRPGGVLVAQCGGQGNLEVLYSRADALAAPPEHRARFVGFHHPTNFADPRSTTTRLDEAGFDQVRCSLEHAPTPFPTAEAYREFIAKVVLREHLARLPDDATRTAWLDELTELAGRDTPPRTLDYVRLNLRAKRLPS
jgi:trans-aconitate methyltransferase